MRHFLDLDRGEQPPLPVPRLAGGMAPTPLPPLLIAPARRAHPLSTRRLRAGAAIALSTVTVGTDGHLSAAAGTEEESVVWTRSAPGCPGGEGGARRQSESRRYWQAERGGYAAVRGLRGGTDRLKSCPPWALLLLEAAGASFYLKLTESPALPCRRPHRGRPPCRRDDVAVPSTGALAVRLNGGQLTITADHPPFLAAANRASLHRKSADFHWVLLPFPVGFGRF